MSFIKKATLNVSSVYATDENGKFQWRSFVKQANDNPSQDRTDFLPKDAYKYDTNHFLFLTARAISGGEKWGHNGNYDYFPWEEIKKALPTYPGCGFYIEHKEDSEEDAKGIVLDAFANDEEEYAVCLCAIDKDEYPEFCQQILDGTYNQVSMSCLANECECSECGNVAHSFDELCQHMNPNMPITYMKGKTNDKGEDIYEINRDLCFSGLSAVAVPADKDAFVFDIKAAKKKENKLKEELVKYQNIKQAAKMKEFRTACEEEFKSLDTVALLNKLQNCATAITNQVVDQQTGMEVINGPLQGILKQLMELQIGLTILDLNKLANPSVDNTVVVEGEPETEVVEVTTNVEEKDGEWHLLTEDDLDVVNLDKEINSSYSNHDEYVKDMNSLRELKINDYNKFIKRVNQLLKENQGFNLIDEEIVTREDKELFNKVVNNIINNNEDTDDWFYLLYNRIITKQDGKLFDKLVDKFIEEGRTYSLLVYKIITKKDGELFNKLINEVLSWESSKRDYKEALQELLDDKIITKQDFNKLINKQNKETNLDKEIDSYLDGDNWSYTPFSSTASLDKIIEKTYK